jgi:hypothetical protein
VLYRNIQIWPPGIESRDSSEEFCSLRSIAERRKAYPHRRWVQSALCTGEIVMTNSTNAGARVHITAEYLSEDEPVELLLLKYVKSSRSPISAPGKGRRRRMPTLNEIESQTDQAHGNCLEKPCKIIGQKPDKAKCKSLKLELLKHEGKVLQNLYSAVRSRPAPPVFRNF